LRIPISAALRARAGAAIALAMTLWSCSAATPSAPTIALPMVAGSAASTMTGVGVAGNVVTTWSCFTASSAGIFASDSGRCSRTVAGLVQAAANAPSPPSGLTSLVSGGTVTLTWLAPTGTDPATSYIVEAGLASGLANAAVFDTGNTATSLTVSGVPAGTYFVRVRAKNSAGVSGATSEVVVTVGSGAPCTPGAPTGLSAIVSGTIVTLTWNAPGGGCSPTTYRVEAGSSSGASDIGVIVTGNTSTSFVASSVPSGTYFVRVRAANGSSLTGPSNETVLTVNASPGPGGDLTGRWVGVAPDGLIFFPGTMTNCSLENDLRLDLTQVGSALGGTITATIRVPRSSCGQIGDVATLAMTNGTVSGTGFSFVTSSQGRVVATFSGTVTGNRMSGVVIGSGDGMQVGTFAATRQ